MALLTFRNGIKAAYLVIFFTIILMPDVFVGVLLGLLHLLLELFHILFEFVEITLDGVVEHLFHTDTHQTQVIVFYIICSIGLLLLYRLKLALPRYYKRLQNSMQLSLAQAKTRLAQYWLHSVLVRKT
ncbi:MAG: hypothetical protein ABL903_14985 [Methylococcales bacterium]